MNSFASAAGRPFGHSLLWLPALVAWISGSTGLLLAGPPPASSIEPFFLDSGQFQRWARTSPAAGLRRTRITSLNPRVFATALDDPSTRSKVWRMNVFPGEEYVVRLEAATAVARDTDQWSGTAEGYPHSRMILVRRGGLIAATVLIPGRGIYRIEPAGLAYAVTELDSNRLPACGTLSGAPIRAPKD